MENINIYAVSDSLGETAEQVARAVIRQFDTADFDIKRVSYVNDKETIDNLIEKASKGNSFIIFTLVVEELRDYLTEKAFENKIEAVDDVNAYIESCDESYDDDYSAVEAAIMNETKS